MRDASRVEFYLEGLNCAACAARIEEEAKRIRHVDRASLNLATNVLAIDAADVKNHEQIMKDVSGMVKEIEPGVTVKILTGKEERTGFGGSAGTREAAVLLAGGILFAAALLLRLPNDLRIMLYAVGYLLVGGRILAAAGRNLIRGRAFDENLLMSISTLGAFAIREYPEAVAVMLFFRAGEFLQDLAVNRSRKSIADLMDIRPEYANIKTPGGLKRVSPAEVRVGDIILVKPGERIPLDGVVEEGISAVDTSALTGEAVPRDVEPGSGVLSGFINKNGVLSVRTTREFKESAVAKILELVEDAGARKAPTEKFITRFSRYYTPAVVFAAAALALVPPLLIPGAHFSDWVYRALVFLVVSCPCALVISIPLGFFGGIGGASKNGILIKGGNFLEALAELDTVVFDKTGTLTKGVFKVTRINPADGVDENKLLEYIARAEYGSNHPVALAIIEAYGKKPDGDGVKGYTETPGLGVEAVIDGKKVLAGSTRLMEREGIAFQPVEEAGTAVYAALDGKFIGSVVVSDEIKEDAAAAIRDLKALGVRRTMMLTGDSQRAAEEAAKALNIDEVHAELLPHQKVAMVEAAQGNKTSRGRVVFVGDGINDAPALARADIGVAMGGLGSDAAIEAADVVIMTDRIGKLAAAVRAARRTRAIVWQNIIFALAVKGIVLLLGAGGIASMWEAVFADVGVALIAVLNSMRAIKP
ncbi:MAG: cadmium-translocating P-type ATPase [Clostridiales bacterium]|nr:cadmium-translocating P-type ATPase [Clostridiales bacterium]